MTQTDKQAHTPGPWHVQGLQVDPHGIIRIGGFEVVTEAYDVVGGNPGVAPIRNAADARLIAAAPDLLEACELALDGLHYTREYVGEATLPAIEGWSWYDATVALKAAIAKYKGVSP